MSTISICIPVYNQSSTIKETIEAALAQKKMAYEIIVSENFSNDGTSEIVETYNEQIRIIRPISHCSATENFNFAVNSCKSEWIAICSGDDILLPNYIEEVSKCISKTSDAVFIIGGWENYNETTNTTRPHYLLSMGKVTRPPKTLELQLLGPKASFSAFCFRKDAFVKIGGFNPNYRVIQDWMFQFDISKLGAVVRINDLIARYRISTRVEIETERLPQYAQDRLLYLDTKIWEAIDFGVSKRKVLKNSRKIFISVLDYLVKYSIDLDILHLDRMHRVANRIGLIDEYRSFISNNWINNLNRDKLVRVKGLVRAIYNKFYR